MFKKVFTYLVLVGVVLAINSLATTHTVGTTGTYATINAALASASVLDGDTILMIDPVHTEAGVTVNKSVVIMGVGKTATIMQADTSYQTAPNRVFTIASGKNVTIQDMTVRYGMVIGTPAQGGGIFNRGALTVSNCIVSFNFAMGSFIPVGNAWGGGIYNDTSAVLVTQNSVITDNLALGGIACLGGTGSGGDAWGGGIANLGMASVITCTVKIDSAVGGAGLDLSGGDAWGGGIYNSGKIDIQDSEIYENIALGGMYCFETVICSGGVAYGGGVANDDEAGDVIIITTSVYWNTAEGGWGTYLGGNAFGGGMYNNGNLVDMDDCCVHCNLALGGNADGSQLGGMDFGGNGHGGGIANVDQKTFDMVNATVSGNTALGGLGVASGWRGVGYGGGIWGGDGVSMMDVTVAGMNYSDFQGGGVYSFHTAGNQGPVFKNTIVADDSALMAGNDIYNNLQSHGYNLVENTVGGTIDTAVANGNTGKGNIIGLDPVLDTLAFNGGPTETQALKTGSPAIDAGDFTGAPTNDQRGYTRSGSSLDIGAYEYQGAVPVVLTSYAAEVTAGGVTLFWSTASEKDNLGFNILKSASATSGFTQINSALIAGAGTTVDPQNYSFTDADATIGTWWYRLEQVDLAGQAENLATIKVEVPTGLDDMFHYYSGKWQVQVFSPAREFNTVLRLAAPENIRIVLTDVSGQVRQVLKDGLIPAGVHELTVESALAPGIYLVTLKGKAFTQVEKLVIIK